MEEIAEEVRALTMANSPFLSIVGHLRSRPGFVLRPFNVVRVCSEALSIPWMEVRNMLDFFDQDMSPVASPDVIESQWERLLAGRGQ
jgi:hypothetical protein